MSRWDDTPDRFEPQLSSHRSAPGRDGFLPDEPKAEIGTSCSWVLGPEGRRWASQVGARRPWPVREAFSRANANATRADFRWSVASFLSEAACRPQADVSSAESTAVGNLSYE